MERIENVVNRYWKNLLAGQKVHIPTWAVEPIEGRPDLFAVTTQAWPVGQTCDYIWRLPAGGRIHAQCCTYEGQQTLRFHLDRWDPQRTFGDFVAHGLFETPIGPVLGAVLAVSLVAAAANS